MKIVDAFWEKRNLGVECIEIHIDDTDSVEAIEKAYSAIEEKEYMVARIPSVNPDTLFFFEQQGYRFIEAAITLENNMNSINPPLRIMRVCEKCSYAPMNENDIAVMETQIDKNIFKTDRIYIDPFFTKAHAAQRYKFWIRDIIAKGGFPHKVIFNGETVGFFVNQQISTGVYDGLFAATYQQYEGSGMGICVQYMGLKMAMENGAKKYIGHISCNNPDVFKALIMLNFNVKKTEYVLIKHL